MSDKRTPNIVATAPERIYLVIGEDVNKSTDFADLGGEGITWCEDKIDGNSIEYVRADKSTHPPESALQRLTEAGEIQAAMERIADLESALRDVTDSLDRMGDKADDRICPNVWREVNAERRIAAARAALAGKPAPRLTDADIALCMLMVDDPALFGRLGSGNGDCIRQFARAIEAKVRGE